jgi:phosphonate transport system substrate-binding protein
MLTHLLTMSKRRLYTLLVAVVPVTILLLATACSLEPAQDSNATGGQELVISFTPEADPLHLELDAKGLAAFLAEELNMPVTARVDADYAATVEAMAAGHVHIATNLAPLQAAVAHQRAGAHIILVEERDGQAYYRSRFWVRKDSGLETLEDLRGTRVAFNDPLSGSGYLMPVATLVQEGLIAHGEEIHQFFAQVYFAGGTELSMRALVEGHVDVAPVSENAAEIFLSPTDRKKVTYITESDPMPRHAIAVSGQLPDELVQRITEAFLKLNEAEHNEILAGLYGWRKVVPADTDRYLPLLEKARDAGILD